MSTEIKETRINLLHVRWFTCCTYEGGDTTYRQEKIRFIEEEDNIPAYGFINPDDVVRAVHLLPSFPDGVAEAESPYESFKLSRVKRGPEYMRYYVNR